MVYIYKEINYVNHGWNVDEMQNKMCLSVFKKE